MVILSPGRKWRIKQAPSTNQDQIFESSKAKQHEFLLPMGKVWSLDSLYIYIYIYNDLELPLAQDALWQIEVRFFWFPSF